MSFSSSKFDMDSSGFSSPRAECFPAGLRVLVVDDDPTWLKILEKMLKRCNYEGSFFTPCPVEMQLISPFVFVCALFVQ